MAGRHKGHVIRYMLVVIKSSSAERADRPEQEVSGGTFHPNFFSTSTEGRKQSHFLSHTSRRRSVERKGLSICIFPSLFYSHLVISFFSRHMFDRGKSLLSSCLSFFAEHVGDRLLRFCGGSQSAGALRQEAKLVVKLAVPVFVTQLCQIGMNITDTIFVV